MSWKCKSIDSIQSSVGCLQLFSDKSRTSLNGGSLSAYRLQITLLNLSEEQRRGHIVSGRTIFD